ncbi:hypothetical protein HK102_013927 [Quaeritorhiza haematococci]|nr:hypothetical protein HK102_013927 [Quaeritorhiza haematococci]
MREKEAENLRLRELIKKVTNTPTPRAELSIVEQEAQRELELCGPSRERATKRRKIALIEELSAAEYRQLRKKTTISVLCDEAFPKKVNNLDVKDPTYVRLMTMIAEIRGSTVQQLVQDGFVLSDVMILNYITDASHDRSLLLADIKKYIQEANPYHLHGSAAEKLAQINELLASYKYVRYWK